MELKNGRVKLGPLIGIKKIRAKNYNTNISDDSCILKTDIKTNEQKYSHIINKYTKLDPTLPRVFNIKCPNENCKTNTDGEKSEVLYIRYDENNMKYLYMCSICDTTWKTNDASL